MLYIQFWAPDDGQRYRLKHVEHFTEIIKLCNIASCWLYLEIICDAQTHERQIPKMELTPFLNVYFMTCDVYTNYAVWSDWSK
jgi:hypothetical protein